MSNLLNKKTTILIHAIAILLMIYHHVFSFGNGLAIEESKSLFDYLNFIHLGSASTFQESFAWFSRICVAMFAFTSGYGIYLNLKDKSLKDMYKYIFKKILSFYKKYFLVFIIFVNLMFIKNIFSLEDTTILIYILNLLGLSSRYINIWWYVAQYYLMLVLSPLIYICLNKIKIKELLMILGSFILILIGAFIIHKLPEFIYLVKYFIQTQVFIYLFIFFEGMFLCKYNLVNIIGNKLNYLLSILILIIVFILRAILIRAITDSVFDVMLISPLIISLVVLLKNVGDNNILLLIGRNSTYMWFVHGFFYAVLFSDFVINCDYSIIIYLQVIIYSLATSICLTQIEKLIFKR